MCVRALGQSPHHLPPNIAYLIDAKSRVERRGSGMHRRGHEPPHVRGPAATQEPLDPASRTRLLAGAGKKNPAPPLRRPPRRPSPPPPLRGGSPGGGAPHPSRTNERASPCP